MAYNQQIYNGSEPTKPADTEYAQDTFDVVDYHSKLTDGALLINDKLIIIIVHEI